MTAIKFLSFVRALVHAMLEILFLCGMGNRAVVATIGSVNEAVSGRVEDQVTRVFYTFIFDMPVILLWNLLQKTAAVLEGLSVDSAMDLQKVLRISTFTSRKDAFNSLIANISLFESRLGAMLFLISALLSRGLVCLCLSFSSQLFMHSVNPCSISEHNTI